MLAWLLLTICKILILFISLHANDWLHYAIISINYANDSILHANNWKPRPHYIPMTSCAQLRAMWGYYEEKFCDKKHIETKYIFIVVTIKIETGTDDSSQDEPGVVKYCRWIYSRPIRVGSSYFWIFQVREFHHFRGLQKENT